jgi:hypothetical protein
MHELQQRINRLERLHRIYSVILVFFSMTGIIATFSWVLPRHANGVPNTVPDTASVLRTRKLEVIGPQNQTVFTVYSDAGDAGVMELNHQNGKPLLVCRTGDFGQPAMAIYTAKSEPLVLLGQNAHKTGGMLQVASQDSVPVLWATSDEKGEGQLSISSKDGKTVRKIGPKP